MCALRAVGGGVPVAEILPGGDAEMDAGVTARTADADAEVGGAVGAVDCALALAFAVPPVLSWLCGGVCNGTLDDCT